MKTYKDFPLLRQFVAGCTDENSGVGDLPTTKFRSVGQELKAQDAENQLAVLPRAVDLFDLGYAYGMYDEEEDTPLTNAWAEWKKGLDEVERYMGSYYW